MTAVGLQLAPDASEDELMRLAEGLGVINDAACFAVGDISNFYREHFPQRWREWIERGSPIKGLDNKTVKVYGAVCAAYDHEARARHMASYAGHPGVSFSHFSRVRRYGTVQAEYWLSAAAEEGWSLEELERRIEGGTPGSDDVPPVPEAPTSVFGQAYWLGPPEDPQRHMLLCGDATVPEHLAMLGHMGARASMVWTDPPYGVDYVGKTEEALTIQHDVGGEGLYALLVGAWAACAPVLEDCAPFYVAGPTGNNALTFLRSFEEAGWRYKQMLVWVKNTMVLGRQDHQLKHEGLFYGNAPGTRIAGRMSKDSYRWYGGDNVTSVFEVDKPSASRDHPTMKPVKLILPGIENCSRPGEVVLDPFAGSGSTLIAADQLGRRCFAIEYDPAYADVIRARYVDYLEKRASGLIAATQELAPSYEPGPFEE